MVVNWARRYATVRPRDDSDIAAGMGIKSAVTARYVKRKNNLIHLYRYTGGIKRCYERAEIAVDAGGIFFLRFCGQVLRF